MQLLPPYYTLNIIFPKGSRAIFTKKKEISILMSQLKNAKQYLPTKESNFLLDEYNSLRDYWEQNDIKPNYSPEYEKLNKSEIIPI